MRFGAAALALVFACGAPAQESRPACVPGKPEAETRPGSSRLVLLVVVDQLAPEILKTAWPHLGPDGFKRLAREGAYWPDAAHDHSCSETGPGHASLSTGATPSVHGIVGNEWIDAATGQLVGCVDDPSVQAIGGSADVRGSSAHRLLVQTFGEALGGKSVAVSIKDRSAVLPAGPSGSAVWFDRAGGRWVSSTAFRAPSGGDLLNAIDWISRLNALPGVESYATYVWEKVGPAAAYADLGPDDDQVELSLDGSRKFPHDLGRERFAKHAAWVEALCSSPAGLDLVLAAARFLLNEGRFGRDGRDGFFSISFSSNDLVGHRYGPESHEVRDMTLRTDAVLAEILRDFDRLAGAGRYHVILSADHGIGPIPEALVRRGIAAGRLNADKLRGAIERGLNEAYGTAPESRHWVKRTLDADVLLDRPLLAEKKIALDSAQDQAAQSALAAAGVAEAIAVHRIFDGSLPPSPIHDAIRRGQMQSRSVDLYVVPKPHWLFTSTRANHGTPYEYDRRVPLFLAGPGVKRGYTGADSPSPASGVVTIAAALGIAPPSGANHPVLQEALDAAESRRTGSR